MDKKRAKEIMRELKEHCQNNECATCIFFKNDKHICKLSNTSPNYYDEHLEKPKEYNNMNEEIKKLIKENKLYFQE